MTRPNRLAERISSGQIDAATRQLATLLRAGIPLAQALQTLARTSDGGLRGVFAGVRRDIEAGSTLEHALARHPSVFDALFRSLVAAGELGGLLDTVLERIASHRERGSWLRDKVRSALVYPLAVLTVAVLSVGVILVWVVPGFQALFDRAGAELPWPTRVLILLSAVLLDHGIWILLALAMGGIALTGRLKRSPALQQRAEGWLLRLPLLGKVLADAAAARWCRTLAMLLAAGVPLDDALKTVARVGGQRRLTAATQNIRHDVAAGRPLAPGMARSGCFPVLAVQMVEVGEESGTLDTLLARAADTLEQRVEQAVARMTTLLEPAIMLVLGVVMGGVIIALYLPVFQLGTAIA